MNYSPILLFCYKRLETLKRCVNSLKECPESRYSDLIIISDWAAKDKDIVKVNEVRNFLPSVTGFKSIQIIEREQNLGVDFNIIAGIKEMSDRFNKFIVVEDDLEVVPDFLRFLNCALDFYATNEKVLTISAFNFVNKIPGNYEYDVYFANRCCAWGWASWSDKIKKVDWQIEDKELFLKSRKLKNLFNEWGSDRSSMLVNTLNGTIKAWDIRLDYFQFKGGFCSVYPIHTLVENIGFGGTDASNTSGYNRFKTKLKFTGIQSIRFPEKIFYEKVITKNFIWKSSILLRIHTRIMRAIRYNN